MATLPTLLPTGDAQVGTWVTDASGTTNLWQKIDEGIAAAVDTADFIQGPNAASNTTANQYEAAFTDMPADFLSMTSLSVQARVIVARTDDTLSLVIRIESPAGVAYTNDVTFASLTNTSWTSGNTAVTAFTLTSAGSAATRTDWNAALLVLSQTWSANMSADATARVQVSAVELTGVYASGASVAPVTISATTAMPSVVPNAGTTFSPSTISTLVAIDAATAAVVPQIEPPTIGVSAIGVLAIGVNDAVNATAAPTTISAVVTAPAPTITYGATEATSTVQAAITMPAATAGVSKTVTPTTIAASTTLPAPTVSYGATFTSTPIQALTTLPQATPSASVSVSPSTIAAATTHWFASMSTGSTATSQAIATSIAMDAPTLSRYIFGVWGADAMLRPFINANAGPSTITAATLLPAVSTTQNATATPATITSTTSIPAATASGTILAIDFATSFQSTTSQTSASFASGLTWQQGDLILVLAASDNAGSQGAVSLTSISDAKGTTYSLSTANYDPGAANAGATFVLAYGTIGSAGMTSTDQITLGFSTATGSKAALVYRIRPNTGNTAFVDTNYIFPLTTTGQFINSNVLSTYQQIVFVAGAAETNLVPTTDSAGSNPPDDASQSAVVYATANTGNAATSMQVAAVWNRREITGQAYSYAGYSYASSVDYAFIAFVVSYT